MIHIDYSPIPKCKNPDSFGMICVKCNKCGRFTKTYECINCGKIKKGLILPRGWRTVEFYDALCVPICTQCKKRFSKKEIRIDDYSHEVIGCKKTEFVKR